MSDPVTLEQAIEAAIHEAHDTSLRKDAWKTAAKAAVLVVRKYAALAEAVAQVQEARS